MPTKPIDSRQLAALRRRIPRSYLSFEFARSSGPGGQNVNKVNTRATLWFNLDDCPVLTPAEKKILQHQLAGRISSEGWLRVVSRKYRTQDANKRAAMERFYRLITAALTPARKRIATRVTATQKRRRLEDKRRTSQKKQMRNSRSIERDG